LRAGIGKGRSPAIRPGLANTANSRLKNQGRRSLALSGSITLCFLAVTVQVPCSQRQGDAASSVPFMSGSGADRTVPEWSCCEFRVKNGKNVVFWHADCCIIARSFGLLFSKEPKPGNCSLMCCQWQQPMGRPGRRALFSSSSHGERCGRTILPIEKRELEATAGVFLL
jgi:hypothetical protein